VVVRRPQDLSLRRARGGAETLELQAVQDVGDLAGAVLGHLLLAVEVVAGGGDDSPDLFFDDFGLLVEVDRLGVADVGALAAGDGDHPRAALVVEGVSGGDRLGEGHVDRLAPRQAEFEFARGRHGADLGALVAEDAFVGVDVGRLLEDSYLEVPHVAADLLDFAVDHELDLGVLGDLDHLRGQDALGAVEGGEGLRELDHVPADRGLPLDENDLVAAVGEIEGRLDAGDASAYDQGAVVDGEGQRLEILVSADPLHGAFGDLLRLFRPLRLVLVNPAALLADIGDFALELVDAGPLGGIAESLLVEIGAAAGDDDAVELLLLDRLLDFLLPGIGAHVDVVDGVIDVGVLRQLLGHALDVDGAGNVDAAVADKNACPFLHFFLPFFPCPLFFRASSP
jgi:hypothetical protein